MDSSDKHAVLRRVGLNIKAERARRELTQEALAHLVGIGVAQLARMERGETDSGLSSYVGVARALEVDPALLLQGLR
ncbi:helix-turn-helix domain-containing protein [Nocardioides aromaticivorans]|uniref:helix-turn-helix domain-containing protein n=1 Tax=Nocardioides aromaticivorans TaxID=200618 RepID=UPI0015CAEFFA